MLSLHKIGKRPNLLSMLFDQFGNRKYLTTDECRAFLGSARKAPLDVETFCLTLMYTGARISEVLALTPIRIDTSTQAIVIECLKKRKRGVYRSVPVPIELLLRIEEVHAISTAQTDPHRASQRIWAWGRTTAWQRVKEVMREANIPARWAMPKSLRHAFGVTGVMEASVPLNMMQKWLGHSRIETTAIYVNAIGMEERALAARMWLQHPSEEWGKAN